MKKRLLSILMCVGMMMTILSFDTLALVEGTGPVGVSVFQLGPRCKWRTTTDFQGQIIYELVIEGGGMAAVSALPQVGFVNARISASNSTNEPLTLVIDNLHLYYNNQVSGGQWDKHAPLEIYGTSQIDLLLSRDNTFGTGRNESVANGNGCNGIGVYTTSTLVIDDAPNYTNFNGFSTDADVGTLKCNAGGGGAAGIGGIIAYEDSTSFPHGDVIINGGTITVEGSGKNGGAAGGAGIGGSATADFSPNGGNVTINGGTVSVESYLGAAAIGGAAGYIGANGPVYGIGAHVAVNGGVLTAKADVKTEVLSSTQGYVYRTGMVIGAGANEANVLTTKTNGIYDQSFSVQNAIVRLSANDSIAKHLFFPINVESYAEEEPYMASHIKNCVFGYETHTSGFHERLTENVKVYGNFKLTHDYTIKTGSIIEIPSDASFTVALGTKLTIEPVVDPGRSLNVEEMGMLFGRTNSFILEKDEVFGNDGKVVGYGYYPPIISMNLPEIPAAPPGAAAEADENRIVYIAVVEKSGSTQKQILAARNSSELAAQMGNNDLLTVITAGYQGFEPTENGYKVEVNGIKTIDLSLTSNSSLCGKSLQNTAIFEIKEEDGSVIAEGTDISLSSPVFTVFSPKKGKGFTINFPSDTDMSAGKLAFSAEFFPDDNNALINIPELFGSSFMLESVSPVKKSTSLRFAGKLALSTPIVDIAGIEISKLQMDFAGKSVSLGGIAGGGNVNIPKIAGFVGGKAETRINTFIGEGTDEAEFMFSVEAKTPVFDGEFYLDFKEAYGVILPNSFYMAGKVGTQGIPLVPPTTVAYITGGGLGVYGLAETIGMKRFALPPIRLRLTGSGSIVDIMEGTMDLTVGPGYSNIELSDIELADMANILSKVGMKNSFNLEQFKYRDITYDVLAAHNKMYIEAGLELGGVEFLEADGSVGFDALSGLSVDVDAGKVHGIFRLQSTGELGGAIKIPKKSIFGLPLWDFNFADVRAGYRLAGTHAPTLSVGDPMAALDGQAMLDATKFEGAIAAKASFNVLFTQLWARVGYILGGSPSFDGGFGEGPELLSSSESSQKPALSYAEKASNGKREGDYSFIQLNGKVLADTSETSGVALMSVIGDIPTGVTLSQTDTDEKVYSAAIDNTISNPAQVLFVMTGKNGEKIEEGDICVINTAGDVSLIAPVPDIYDEDYDGDYDEQKDNGANFAIDEDGRAYFTINDYDTYTITSAKAMDIQAVQFSPFATLNEINKETDSTAGYSINNYNSDAEYAIHVYLGKNEGDMDYLLTEATVDADTGSIDLPIDGTMAPSGNNYKVTVALMEEAVIDTESGNVSGWVIADTKSVPGDFKYTYTGTSFGTIESPSTASLSYSGNETMTASWDAVDVADGYLIHVYDSNGDFTGVSYQTTVEKDGNGEIIAAAPTTVTMALTADTAGPDAQIISGLETGKEYSVGVSAFKNVSTTTDMPGDAEDVEMTSQVVSTETMSDVYTLYRADSPTLTYSSNVSRGVYNQHTLMLNPASSHEFRVTSSSDCNITVRNITDRKNPSTIASGTDISTLFVTVPEFIGSVLMEILATNSNGDYALEYVTVQLDENAPVLTLDNGGVFYKAADDDGTVTGKTEAYARVCAWQDASATAPIETVQADIDGVFTMSLDEGSYTIEAIDYAENRSIALTATITINNKVTPETASYALRSDASIDFTLKLYDGATLQEVRLGDTVLTKDVDYTFSENICSIKPNALKTLTEGDHMLVFDMSEGNDPQVLLTATAYVTPKYRSSGGRSTSKSNIKLISQGKSTPVTVSVIGDVANLSFNEKELSAMLADPAVNGELTLDLTPLEKTVNAVNFKENDWNTISDAVNTQDNPLTEFALKLDSGSLCFDKKALAAASEIGKDITISIKSPNADELTEQQTLMAGGRYVVDVSVLCGDTPLTDLKDGTLRISIPYTPVAKEKTDFLVLWHLSEDGQTKAYQCEYAGGQLGFTLNHLSTYAVAYFPFTDIPENQWYYGDAAWAYMKGLMTGEENNRFAPNISTSRAMVVTMLHRLEGKPVVSSVNSFADVDSNQWYTEAIAWATGNGIVDGYDSTRFGPDDPITREQMAAILYRYEQHKGGEFSDSQMFSLNFHDADMVSAWAYDAMCWCIMNKIFEGSNGNLAPHDNAERCQVAAILHRFCVNSKK